MSGDDHDVSRASTTGPTSEAGFSFRADLQSDDGWADAVAGCDYVLHVASPTLRNAPESEEAMISAARDGVLRAPGS